MLNAINQPANRAMLATQQQAHYSDYDKRENNRADNHSRLVQKCRKRHEGWELKEGWDGKVKGQSK